MKQNPKCKRVVRRNLSVRIRQRMTGIKYVSIRSAVNVIINQLIQDMIDDRSVSVERFGTLSPYVVHGHVANNAHTGELHQVPPQRMVKLNAHQDFIDLLFQKVERFKKSCVLKKNVDKNQ